MPNRGEKQGPDEPPAVPHHLPIEEIRFQEASGKAFDDLTVFGDEQDTAAESEDELVILFEEAASELGEEGFTEGGLVNCGDGLQIAQLRATDEKFPIPHVCALAAIGSYCGRIH
jgi:hypothetical protein